MTRGLYNELIKTKDAVNRLQTALKNSALHALYQGHRADDAEAELSEQNETIERLRACHEAELGVCEKHCEVVVRLRAERDALREKVERQHKGLKAVEDLINESDGVYGYHLNGDLSPWEDFRTGGCNEAYLMEFDEALEGGE